MSALLLVGALLEVLVPAYAAVALLLPVALGVVRGGAWLLARAGLPLGARQALAVARAALVLALTAPVLAAGVRALVPAAPLFAFERTVVRHTGRLPVAPAAPALAVAAPTSPALPARAPVLPWAMAGVLLPALALGGVRAVQAARLRARLVRLPLVRRVGRVGVAVGDDAAAAYAAWLPGAGVRAWVVVPARLAEDAEALRLTVLHELQHHRQGDTRGLWARALLTALYWWHPAAHLWARWLGALGELACDEALVHGGRARPHAYARVLLEAALARGPLPAGVAGMSHPTTRRVEMLFQTRSPRRGPAAALLAATLVTLAPLAVLAQSAARPRTLSLEEARALAQATNAAGDVAVVVDPLVVQRLNRLVGTPEGRAYAKAALENLGRERARLLAPFTEKGLPEGLLAVAFVESGVRNLPEAENRGGSTYKGPRGAGVWQFIAPTARRYGMVVDGTRDERLDVEKQTRAAAAMFADLQARYGDWRLALAAYNEGERKVDAGIAAAGSRDVSALAAAGKVGDYAASVQAALLVLRNPHLLD